MKKYLALLIVLVSCTTNPSVFDILFTVADIYEFVYTIHDPQDDLIREYHLKESAVLTVPNHEMERQIFLVAGVREVGFVGGAFLVRRSPLYTWEEVEPDIVKRIEEGTKEVSDGTT